MSSFIVPCDEPAQPALISRRSFRSEQGFTPTSPTDKLLSPCSKRLWGPKRMHSPDMNKEIKKLSLDIDAHVQPMQFPYPDIALVVGSSSLHRKGVVDRLGWAYSQISPDIDEKAIRDDDPLELPVKVAIAKAAAVVSTWTDQTPRLLITCDQIVLYERNIREKPIDVEQARQFLLSYSDKSVSTVSAICITHYPSGKQLTGVDVATVFWDVISDEIAKAVVDKGIVMTCAGGFQIEEPLLQPLVKGIDGGLDSIIGFPIQLTLQLLDELMMMLACEEAAAAMDLEEP